MVCFFTSVPLLLGGIPAFIQAVQQGNKETAVSQSASRVAHPSVGVDSSGTIRKLEENHDPTFASDASHDLHAESLMRRHGAGARRAEQADISTEGHAGGHETKGAHDTVVDHVNHSSSPKMGRSGVLADGYSSSHSSPAKDDEEHLRDKVASAGNGEPEEEPSSVLATRSGKKESHELTAKEDLAIVALDRLEKSLEDSLQDKNPHFWAQYLHFMCACPSGNVSAFVGCLNGMSLVTSEKTASYSDFASCSASGQYTVKKDSSGRPVFAESCLRESACTCSLLKDITACRVKHSCHDDYSKGNCSEAKQAYPQMFKKGVNATTMCEDLACANSYGEKVAENLPGWGPGGDSKKKKGTAGPAARLQEVVFMVSLLLMWHSSFSLEE